MEQKTSQKNKPRKRKQSRIILKKYSETLDPASEFYFILLCELVLLPV